MWYYFVLEGVIKMPEKMTYINPEMLIWAREQSRSSIEDVMEKFGADKITDWENGEDYPTYSQLKEIANYYRKPVAVFFFPEPPIIKNIISSCRTLPINMNLLFTRNITKLMDEARVMQINLYELNEDKNPNIHKINNQAFDCFNIKAVAKETRRILNISLEQQKRIRTYKDAFEIWRESFYQIGIYVFKSAFMDDNISGFCLYDNEFPIIYINNSFSFSRQIFTLFHELYHLLYKTSGIDLFKDPQDASYRTKSDKIIENYCNRFASEFLVPSGDFEFNIHGKFFSETLVEKLASTYCVSREVILRKFFDRDYINQEEYSSIREEYLNDYFRFVKNNSDRSGSGNYYNTQMSYLGKRYLRLSFVNYYQKKISITQLSKYLNMKIPSLKKIASMKGWGSL
jgi:Zn-dependent peptidase ImmA (M78 family)/transcriptional regulator with XRE-family HTH domain